MDAPAHAAVTTSAGTTCASRSKPPPGCSADKRAAKTAAHTPRMSCEHGCKRDRADNGTLFAEAPASRVDACVQTGGQMKQMRTILDLIHVAFAAALAGNVAACAADMPDHNSAHDAVWKHGTQQEDSPII
jgi:hypothetical protein